MISLIVDIIKTRLAKVKPRYYIHEYLPRTLGTKIRRK